MRGTWILLAVGAALLAAVIAGATWLSQRKAAPAAGLSIIRAEPTTPAAEPSTSIASVPSAAASTAAPPAVRSELEVGDETLPPDVHWVSGRVRIPPGTPLDERIRVVALGRKLAGREAHAAEVDGDGYFRIAFSPDSKHGRFGLESSYLYLPNSPRIDVRDPPDDLELEPELGGRVAGELRLPPGETAPHAALVGKQLQLWGSERVGTNSWRSVESRQVTLTADLEFEVGGLRPLPLYHLRLEAGPYRSIDRQGLSIQPGETTELELQLEPGATLAGRVVDPGGAAVTQAVVELEFDHEFGWSSPREVRTDEEGRFEFLGVDPKPLTIRATTKDAPAVELEIEELAAREERRDIEILLAGGSALAGHVAWPDGSPVADGWVEVELQDDEDQQSWRDAETRRVRIADGAFEFEGLTPGRWNVHAWAKLAAAAPEDEDDLPLKERIRSKRERRQAPTWHARLADVAPGSRELALVLDQGHALVGRVTDERGQPLDRFYLKLTPTDGTQSPWERRNEAFGRRFEAADGAFEFDALEPGSYQLQVEAAGHAPVETDVAIPTSVPLPLVVPRTATVSGRVVDRDGGPIEGATVAATKNRPGFGSSEDASDAVETDAEGNFELDDVHPGMIRLRAFAPGLASTGSEPLQVEPGARYDGLVLRAGLGGRIVGQVLDATGSPKPETNLSLSEQRTGDHHWTKGDHEGRFTFENLPAGRFVLQVNPSGEDYAALRDADGNVDPQAWRELALQRVVELAEGQTVELLVQPGTEAAFPVEGVVLANGEPVARASLLLQPTGRRLWSMNEHLVTDDAGRFELNLRADGAWTAAVTVAEAGGLRHDFAFEVPSDGPLVFELPVGTIAGRVVDAAGAPVPGIPVRVTMGGPGSKFSQGSAVIADAEGRFAVLHLSPGVYGLAAGAPRPWEEEDDLTFGRGSVRGLELGAGDRLDGVEIVVVEPGSVEGTVTTPAGVPVADARIFLVGPDGRVIDEHANHRSDSSGRFRITNAPVGPVSLRASATPATTHGSVSVTVRSAAVARADLTLERGTTIAVEPLLAGQPTTVTVEARGTDGVDYAQLGAQTFGNGLTRIGPVPPGTYTLTARAPGGETATETVSVHDQLELSIVLELH